MKIGVLSDTRVPTKRSGGHGLGRMAWDIADGLAKRGHNVTLYAGADSEPSRDFVTWLDQDETVRAKTLQKTCDAYIDVSHYHQLSRLHPDYPVVNWLVDLEFAYFPPRMVVGNEWQLRHAPGAKIVPLGIDTAAIPLGKGGGGLLFAAKIHKAKGFDLALEVATKADKPVKFVGQNFANAALPNYCGEIHDNAKLFAMLGEADGLLATSRDDAGGRVVLEAAAAGTPALAFDWTGTQCHVRHCVSGYICADVNEMVEAVGDLASLSRTRVREWVCDTHDLRFMIDGVESLCKAAADGETW